MLDSKFWYRVGPNVRNRYRTHIFDKAKDVYGKSFKGYSNIGSKWVTMNVKKEHKKNITTKCEYCMFNNNKELCDKNGFL